MQKTNEFSKRASDLIDAGLFAIAKFAPYIYPHMLAMERIETMKIGSAGMDMHYRMYYNPQWLVEEMKTKENAAFVIIHEWSHFIRKHGDLRNKHNYNAKLWNIAGDLSINQMEFKKDNNGLKYQMGTGVHPLEPDFKDLNLPMGRTEEEYYKLLMQECEKQQQQQGESGGEGGDDDENGDGKSPSGFGSGTDEGSAATGTQAPWESQETPRMTQAQISAKVQSAAEAIMHEIEHNKGRGNVPAGLELWAKKLTKPQVNWRQRLSSFVWGVKRTGAGRIDHSRHRRRRVNGRTMFFPRSKSVKPTVCFVMDTSGSMFDGSLETGISEIYGALGACDAWVVWCDTQPSGPHKVTSVQDLSRPIGGGGSDMAPGIRVAEKVERCNMVITVTDGDVWWGDHCIVPHMAVIVEGREPCPFGETIMIKNKRRE